MQSCFLINHLLRNLDFEQKCSLNSDERSVPLGALVSCPNDYPGPLVSFSTERLQVSLGPLFMFPFGSTSSLVLFPSRYGVSRFPWIFFCSFFRLVPPHRWSCFLLGMASRGFLGSSSVHLSLWLSSSLSLWWSMDASLRRVSSIAIFFISYDTGTVFVPLYRSTLEMVWDQTIYKIILHILSWDTSSLLTRLLVFFYDSVP